MEVIYRPSDKKLKTIFKDTSQLNTICMNKMRENDSVLKRETERERESSGRNDKPV